MKSLYRPNIQKSIRDLIEKSKGKTVHRMSVSITYHKGTFTIMVVDQGGIKEGWVSSTHPYTQKSVDYVSALLSGKKI